jgi:hypothetical protein
MKKISLKLIAVMLLAFSFGASSQAPFKYLTYIFPTDSLAGFDEKAANQEALSRGFLGSEYYVIMYTMKRDFINKKYGYYPYGGSSSSANAKGPQTPVINAAPCVNEDFESSPSTTSTSTVGTIGTSLLGWQASWGQNSGINGSCTQSGCCPNPGSTDAWIRQTPWTAPPPLGVIGASPFGGTKVIQLNDNITAKGEVVRIQQTFPVTPNNALFQFAYKAAMDGSGHACCDQPYIRVELLDCFNNILACPQVSITPPGPSCATVSATGWTTGPGTYTYQIISYTPNWIVKAIDLSPYLGSCVTIKITVGDCDGWAHYGYAFFDCQCLPMTVTVNNIQFPAGSPIASVAACGVSTATMVAPPGLGPYTWNGPAGSGITANPNQTITTTMPGNYTLVMNPPGICTPITKTVNLQFGTFPTAGFTATNSCTTYTLTNTGTGPPSVQSYSFTGPGAPSSFTTTNASSVVNFGPSSTYTIYQTVTNPQNCPATFSMVITTPPGPSPAFTAAPSWTQCLSGNAFTFNATTATGSHTFAFSPTTGSPPTGFTSTYGPVSFTAAGNYTVVHTINSGGCVSTTQSVVVVNIAPTASIISAVAPPCAGASATLTGAGGPGTLSWAGPAGWTGVGLNATVNNFQSVNNGIYTLTVNNFGCITTKTVQLTLTTQPTATVSNSGPVCLGSPVTFSAVLPPSASYWYWYKSTPYFYGGYNVSNTTIAVSTATTAGTYTFYVGFPGCPAQTYTTNVVVISPTTPTVSNTGPYCVGQTIQLNANAAAGSTFTWSGPGAFTSTLQSPTRGPATTTMGGVYTVTAGVGSCKTTGTTNVIINPSPTVIIGSNSPVCVGNPINLTSSGGTTYTWTGPGGFTSGLQNPVIASSTTVMAGVYTVTVGNASGCKSTGTVNVTINTPTTSAANTGPYCPGQTITLTTPAATTYTWSGPSAFTSNSQNPNISSAATAMSGVYTVTSSTGGCIATATTNVLVNPAPTPTASNTGPYCPGNTIQLNVGAFTTYTWSGPSAFSSNSQNPVQTNAQTTYGGSYTVAVASAQGCTNTAVTNVIVNPTPTVNIGSNSPVCVNTAINLTSGGGTGYQWSGPNSFSSTLQNPVIPAATTANSGIYTVTVTALGCTDTGTLNVTVVTPTTSASNTGPYCAGSTINFSAPAATSYTWSGPGGFTSNSQNPTNPATIVNAGTYNLIVTIGTCTANATTSVVVNPLPTPVANNTGAYCPGNTIQLNVGAFTTYTWSGPASFSSNLQNPTQLNALTSNGGVYSVSVTDANGCVNTATTNVVVNPNPVAVLSSNSPVCINTSINLTANGGTGYQWSGPNGFTSTNQNPIIPNASALEAGVYTVTVTALGCTGTGSTSVVVLNPTTSATNTGPYCAGATMSLNAPAASSYTWSGPGGFNSSLQNPNAPGATVGMTGTYTVIVSVSSCTAMATTNVVVNALPVPNIVSNSPVCAGQAINLTGSGGTTYTWTGPGSFNSNSSSPSIGSSSASNAGNYILTVTDANGCVNSTNANIIVNPLPVISVNNPTNCENTTVNLTANGAVTYTWSGPGGFTSNSQNPSISSAQLSNTGAYTVTATDANGCVNTAIANASVIALPIPNANVAGPVCAGGTLMFTGSGGTGYSWSGPNSFGSSQPNPNISSASLAAGGVYTLIVTANTCTASATVSAVVNPLPTPNIVTNSPLCIGASLNLTGSGGVNYSWTGPGGFTSTQQNPGIPATALANAGNYVLSVTDANGCTASTNANVIINPLPVPVANGVNLCENNNGSLSASGGTSYIWNGPGGFTSTQQNPVIPNVQLSNAGQYTVTVTNANNCSNTAIATVIVNPAPTPSIVTNSPLCVNNVLSLSGTGGCDLSMERP